MEHITRQTESRTESRSKLKKVGLNVLKNGLKLFAAFNISALVSAVNTSVFLTMYSCDREATDEIDFPHEGEKFKIADLTLREKIAQLLHGSAYDSKMGDSIDRVVNHRKVPLPINFSDWLTDGLKSDENIGGVHIFRSDARTLEETQRSMREIMAKSKIPPFTSMDIVGGYTRHIGLTYEDAHKFGVPLRFILLAKAHNIELPSQEDLGRLFESLKTDKEKIAFRLDMEAYGAAIAKLCRHSGITVDFGPVMDLVEDKDGVNFMEKNDETYSDKIYTVMVLAFHFQKGFQSQNGVLLVPKHFAGTGKMDVNPHELVDQTLSGMKRKSGELLPFKDAIMGSLFSDPISRSDYPLDNLFIDARSKGSSAKLEPYDFGVDVSNFTTMNPVDGIMVGHALSFMDLNTPGTLSTDVIQHRLRDKLGFDGVVWTDDLSMGAIQNYSQKDGCNNSGVLFQNAFMAGATMPMLLHNSGDLDQIVAAVEVAIEKGEMSMEDVDARVQQVLELKVKIGLLTKTSDGHYVNRAKDYLSEK
ncbi:MAG: glycoside hydrolase family 3 N-terminal domain-containing protein [Patescibacteria group bacterium]